ncbi:MAG: hypothetical protein R3E01_05425 [Pirellulaceae bacterium]
MVYLRRARGVVVIVALSLAPSVAQAAFVDWTGGTGDFANNANWTSRISGNFVPDAFLDEVGIVDGGGVAILSGSLISPVGGLRLGETAGQMGTVEVRSGGFLEAATNDNPATDGTGAFGQIVVGQGGVGQLTVLPGGRLSAVTLSSGGQAQSTITLGDTTAGTTQVDVNSATLARTTRVTGPNVQFTAASNVVFQSSHTLVPLITGATHSVLKSNGNFTLNGTLQPQFSGVTPTSGSSWTLAEAPAILGNFTNIDASFAPALASGQAYATRVVAGGAGERAELFIDSLLTLQVDWDSGSMRLVNTSPDAITIDGYSIASVVGALNAGAWNSLMDQGQTEWHEAAPTSNHLNELRPFGATTIASGASFNLGAPFQPVFTQFAVGDAETDIGFEYALSDGTIKQGSIEFSGQRVENNIVLRVDPNTGDAQLINDSSFDVTIDGYGVTSTSGALTPTTWSSLEDQGIGSWNEASPNANQLNELSPVGSLDFQAGMVLELGKIFSVGGSQDLSVSYLFDSASTAQRGVVVYGELVSQSLPGDYNNNGSVDAADYTVWKDNFGSDTNLDADGNGNGVIDAADYTVWKDNFGNSLATVATAAVPEPAMGGWLLCGLIPLVQSVRRKLR